MKINIIASTKVGYELPKEEAVNFSGKSAGICYLPDTLDVLLNEPIEKTEKRASMNILSGHHSVFGHATYNLSLEGIPKILAMILNNEKVYNTSEKSARYTVMQTSDEEQLKDNVGTGRINNNEVHNTDLNSSSPNSSSKSGGNDLPNPDNAKLQKVNSGNKDMEKYEKSMTFFEFTKYMENDFLNLFRNSG